MAILQHKKIRLPGVAAPVGTGWLPPVLDRRDYTESHPAVAPLLPRLKLPQQHGASLAAPLPAAVDLRPWCTPIEDQGGLGSCTANAAAGIVEYFENRAFKRYIDASRLFIYKNTRNLMGVTGDTGAWLRNTMGALALCGVADERYWPYTDAAPAFDQDPPAFVYSVGSNYEALKYFCHDPLGQAVALPAVVASVKKYLAAGIPSMFGFWGFPDSMQSDVPGAFAPQPANWDPNTIAWGHAILAVGYDDNLKITNTVSPAQTAKGAFLIRNSWGTVFGNQGYGWIPYDYVLQNIAQDFWSLLKLDWVNTDQFHF